MNDDRWIQEFLSRSGMYADPQQGERTEIVITRLIKRIECLEAMILGDALQRLDTPGLQEAWEKYQMLKKLTQKN
jgi:metallophosphoesterase superfamily enzyme